VRYFFFFKQKTAYEIRLSLVGSEMCIRDRDYSTLITMVKVWKLGGEYPDPDPIRPGLQSMMDGTRQQELFDFIISMLQELQCFVFQSPLDTNQEDN